MLSCPFSNDECIDSCLKEKCGVYNPVIKGCGLMCSALPMGEELAACRKELSRISDNLETLVRVISSGHGLMVDAIEAVDSSLQRQVEAVDETLFKVEEMAATSGEVPEVDAE
jgi:hypothetical protein